MEKREQRAAATTAAHLDIWQFVLDNLPHQRSILTQHIELTHPETRNAVQKSHAIDCNRMRLTVNRMRICGKRRALTNRTPLSESIACDLRVNHTWFSELKYGY